LAQTLVVKAEDSKGIEKEALYSMVKGLYGERLSQWELEEVKLGVEAVVEDAYALRAVKLEISDEPPTLFRPHRKGS